MPAHDDATPSAHQTQAPTPHGTTTPGDDGAGGHTATDETTAPPEATQRPVRRQTSWPFVLTMLGIAAAATLLGGILWLGAPSGKVAYHPGPTFDIAGTVTGEIRDAEFPDGAHVLMTTVEVKELSNWRWMLTKLPWDDTQTADAAVGSLAVDPHIPRAQMDASKVTAAAVALTIVDGTSNAGQYTAGAKVADVVTSGPADQAGIRIGDVITAVDRTPVADQDELVAALAAHSPHTTVTLTVDSHPVPVTLDAAGRVGVIVVAAIGETPPISSDVDGVGGSSGGLMLTLTFIDALSPGDLFAGRDIAGTGTISFDGTVGRIQGAEHKVVAAIRDGASTFFAPAADTPAASDAADGRIEVISVRHVTDALEWLCSHGADDAICAQLPGG